MSLLLKGVFAKLAANTGLLEASEGHLGVKLVDAVDPGGAGVEPVGGLQSAIDVLGEDGCSETILGIVGLFNDVLVVVELDDNADWAEDLFLYDLHVGARVRKDGWLHPVPFFVEGRATIMNGGTLLLSGFDIF